MPPSRLTDDQEDTLRCLQACCGATCGCILILGLVAFFIITFIMLGDYNIPEIQDACSSNLFNAVLVSVIYLIGVWVTAQFHDHHNLGKENAVFVPMALVLAVLKLSYATENLKSEICHNATTTKFDSQTALAGHASLESLAIFYASLELLFIFGFFIYVFCLRYQEG